MTVRTETWGKNKKPEGVTPAVALVNPKYPHNVGMVQRLASCYGVKQLWWSGERVTLDPELGGRLPREERMKGYQDVELRHYDRFFDAFESDVVPVCVELNPSSEDLRYFEHPEKALYVFGPEDGSIPSKVRRHCHRYVVIPTKHCLNLATAVATVLYDREMKAFQKGDGSVLHISEMLNEERSWTASPEDVVFGSTR